MTTSSPRANRIFFSYRESTSGTPDTTCFFEGQGVMTFPEPEYQFESNKNKLGTGEHGTKAELQAVWTPWSYKCTRMSELAYFLAYLQGRNYTVRTSGDLEQHEFFPLAVKNASRTLPTFTFQYGLGTASGNKVISGNIVNEVSVTFAAGGTGVVDATISGWGNRHRIVNNAIAENAAGSMSSGAFSFASEPLLNFKCTKIWMADTANAARTKSLDWDGENLGASLVELTTLINTITFTVNNGVSAADMARAGGCGIINNFERGQRALTLELNLRKDNDFINTDTLILANTQKAIEVMFTGPYISGTDPYATHWMWPVVQLQKGAEDDATPISKTIPFEVFEDSSGVPLEIFVQSEVSTAYNATA